MPWLSVASQLARLLLVVLIMAALHACVSVPVTNATPERDAAAKPF
jgi:hypothetical protein